VLVSRHLKIDLQDIRSSLSIEIGVSKTAESLLLICNDRQLTASELFSVGHMCSELQGQGVTTAIVDVFTADERLDSSCKYDTHLHALRIRNILNWIGSQPTLVPLKKFIMISDELCGSLGSICKLIEPGDHVLGLISRCGRLNLSHEEVSQVSIPVLLLVGPSDQEILEINNIADDLIDHTTLLVHGAAPLKNEHIQELSNLAGHLHRWMKCQTIGESVLANQSRDPSRQIFTLSQSVNQNQL
jgi:hypothetical protein